MNTYSLLFNALFIAIFMQFVAWLWQIKTKNADIVDITWAAGIVVCTLYYYFSMSNIQIVSYLMLIFPGLWYLRLSVHLIIRYKVSHEDNRYAYLRKHWQNQTQSKFFAFFMFQALLIWIFTIPAFWLSHVSDTLSLNVIIAFALGLISLIGVTIADKQLLNFKQNNATKVCDTGLWKYSRHPNYFLNGYIGLFIQYY